MVGAAEMVPLVPRVLAVTQQSCALNLVGHRWGPKTLCD